MSRAKTANHDPFVFYELAETPEPLEEENRRLREEIMELEENLWWSVRATWVIGIAALVLGFYALKVTVPS